MLKIMVMMIIVPIFRYQSGETSLYLPWRRKLNALIFRLLEYFMFKMIMIKPMFIISKNERFIV